MLSALEQRQIIESAFLPLICRCSIEQDDSLSVQLIDPVTAKPLHHITGIARSTLSTSRGISRFILQLSQELHVEEALRRHA